MRMTYAEYQEAVRNARVLLRARAGDICEGRLEGRHWFRALVEEGRAIGARKRVFEARRLGRQRWM